MHLAIPNLVAAEPPYDTVFETVDGIGFTFGSIDITGIVRSEGISKTVQFGTQPPSIGVDLSDILKTCQRYAETAMSKPGQYDFELRGFTVFSSVYLEGCKLTRRSCCFSRARSVMALDSPPTTPRFPPPSSTVMTPAPR